MIALWKWNLRQLGRQIWVPVAAFGLAGLVAALAAAFLPPVLPEGSRGLIAANAVSAILQIMASSLLAVTTFSISIMLSAFSSAASGATPRATPLLRDDRVTQGVLATFTGGFIYSLVSIIGLETGLYGPEGRFLIFLVTLAVLATIVWQLVRWIGHLANYGRLPDTIARVETAAATALDHRMTHPFLGGRPLDEGALALAAEGVPIAARQTGYVQIVDMEALDRAAARAGITLALTVLPGSFVHPGEELARLMPPARPDDALVQAICAAFAVADLRSFDQDPRFGVLALTEIASRALSPAVNDPGTAIDILGRHLRVLSAWPERADPELSFPHVLVPGLALADLMSDAFDAIARDGASLIEVQVRLQKTLRGLARQAPGVFAAEAARLSRRALVQAEAALVLEEDRDRLRRLSAQITGLAEAATSGPALRKG
ncbi:MAG: DUF2254 domain-containing protein [Rhodobacter sp.]|nr:DUF2254 domain-containing protein [Rhodobacter sp.]